VSRTWEISGCRNKRISSWSSLAENGTWCNVELMNTLMATAGPRFLPK